MTLASEATDMVFKMVTLAQANVSGHRVGAAVIAKNKEGKYKVFGGCNIELCRAMGFHAERVALLKAISEGYINIEAVYVSSSSKEQRAALCGYCRQDFMYVNPNCKIVVLNPDGSIKIETTVIETLNYPYLGKGKIE